MAPETEIQVIVIWLLPADALTPLGVAETAEAGLPPLPPLSHAEITIAKKMTESPLSASNFRREPIMASLPGKDLPSWMSYSGTGASNLTRSAMTSAS